MYARKSDSLPYDPETNTGIKSIDAVVMQNSQTVGGKARVTGAPDRVPHVATEAEERLIANKLADEQRIQDYRDQNSYLSDAREQRLAEQLDATPTVRLSIDGKNKADFPAKYYRIGELPDEAGSKNWRTGEREGGVSVMKGYEDPTTGKITLDGLENEHLELVGEDKLYEVDGTFNGKYGADVKNCWIGLL